MTTTEQPTALATRGLSDKQIRTRMELAQRSFGLQGANQTQLNIVYLLCQRWDLDPLTDITLFEGRPFVTIDGRLRLLRRHPEYRGYKCRPLSKDEKLAWGYEPDDIVVECVVRTSTWGDIEARGKVTAIEVREARERAERNGKRSAPIGVHPVEIAEKRAIARAERAAFGQDTMPDEDEAVTIIEERNDSVKVARDAAAYDRIYGSDADGTQFFDQPAPAMEPPPPAIVAEPTQKELLADYRKLLGEVKRKLGDSFNAADWVLRSDASIDDIEAKGVALGELMNAPQQPADQEAF